MTDICENCTYYLHRVLNNDEDKVERICMIDRAPFDKDAYVTKCNFYNPLETPDVVE